MKPKSIGLELPKNFLMLIAGLVWLFAGSMIMLTGIPVFARMLTLPNAAFAAAVFFVFYWFIFRKLVGKHTNRIKNNAAEKMPAWKFFDLPSYVIMAVMMSGGISLRAFHILPLAVIGPFYTGLGFALFSCGTRFVFAFSRKRVLGK